MTTRRWQFTADLFDEIVARDPWAIYWPAQDRGPGFDDFVELGDGSVLPNVPRAEEWIAAHPRLGRGVAVLPVPGTHGQTPAVRRARRRGKGRPA